MRSAAKRRFFLSLPHRDSLRVAGGRLVFGARLSLAAAAVAVSFVVLTQNPPRPEMRLLLVVLACTLFVFTVFERRRPDPRSRPTSVAGGSGAQDPSHSFEDDLLYELHRDIQVRLRQLEVHRTDYVATVSHELRTPLTSIRGFAQLITREELPPSVSRAYATTIVDEADRLARIVEDVLDLTRMETYMLELRRDLFSASDLLRDVAKRLQSTSAPERLRVELPSGVLWVRGDREKLEQVLLRVVLDAIRRAMPDTPLLLSAEAESDSATIWLQYASSPDQIDGMARALEGLGQAGEDGLATRLGRGRLGLYISKNLIEAHGGKMWLERNGEREVRIGITLPY